LFIKRKQLRRFLRNPNPVDREQSNGR
jgi:hypothetical protein